MSSGDVHPLALAVALALFQPWDGSRHRSNDCVSPAEMIEFHVVLLPDAVDGRRNRVDDLQSGVPENLAGLEQLILNRTFPEHGHDPKKLEWLHQPQVQFNQPIARFAHPGRSGNGIEKSIGPVLLWLTFRGH